MKRIFLAATATGLLMTLNASAALVADFNTSGDYKNPARSRDVNTDTAAIWNYSDTSPLMNDSNGQSGKFYGGVATSWSVAQPAFPQLYVLKNPNDGFVVQVNPVDRTGTQTITGAYLWAKEDFLGGADSQTIAFEAGDSIGFHFDWMTANGSQDLRMIAKQGGVTYVSEWYTQGYQNISQDPSSTNWAVLNTTDYTWDAGAYSAVTLDDIEGAGVYYTVSVTNNQAAARIFDFQVNATVVPEPSVFGLLGLGGLGAMFMRRRYSK